MEQVMVIILILLAVIGYVLWYYHVAYPLLRMHVKSNTIRVKPEVTVVVCAKNEAASITPLIKSLKEQDYPAFKVLVIDDDSHDNTYQLVSELIKNDHRFCVQTLQPAQKKQAGKKGVVAYAYAQLNTPWILHTDADCVPASKQWISLMMDATAKEETELVLGIGRYEKGKTWWQHIVFVETLLIAMQYLGTALRGKPYMAVGRNMAIHYDLYNNVSFDNKILSGDDDLLIQAYATKTNVSIQTEKKAHTISGLPSSFLAYVNMKRRHITTSNYYSLSSKLLLGVWPASLLCAWLGVIFINDKFSLLFLLLLLVKAQMLYRVSKSLKTPILGLKLLFVESYLLIQSLMIYLAHLIRPKYTWK
jgi:biofilm PGA synthesis N-glycosyltransferase PgaC